MSRRPSGLWVIERRRRAPERRRRVRTPKRPVQSNRTVRNDVAGDILCARKTWPVDTAAVIVYEHWDRESAAWKFWALLLTIEWLTTDHGLWCRPTLSVCYAVESRHPSCVSARCRLFRATILTKDYVMLVGIGRWPAAVRQPIEQNLTIV